MGNIDISEEGHQPASAAGHPAVNDGISEPIAIVGYACRLPGHVSSPTDLWELCTRRRSGWSPIPPDRFSSEAYRHPYASKTGTFNPAGGYFLQEDISRFDAPFFNITLQEAQSMDPQQRLLLECSFEALESAGIPKDIYSGQNVGVFIGGNLADYEVNNVRDVETIPMYQATGCAPSLQSNRISYFFNFRGPSLTVDTACSSSLVALHYAVQSLRSGESAAAIVGGCRLNVLPDFFVSMSMSQLFNDEGRTFAFDERAQSGFARGEGVGTVVLKPLSVALRDGDRIRAIIANTGVNQDGKTQGITQPSGQAQESLIRHVYKTANLDVNDCGFAEMHGTGTKVGDPIEAMAVYRALALHRSPQDPLYIGSVKSNVGHLEGASGIISVIKAAMMLENDLILPNMDFETPNKNIPLDEWNMKVPSSTRPWPRRKKYVSVSNYGFGGTNAHAVLQKPPLPSKHTLTASPDTKRKLFVISANSNEALQARARELGIYFEQHPEVFENMLFTNVAYTLGSRRSHLTYRAAFSTTSLDHLGIQLAQMKGNAFRVTGTPNVGFVFTGQGAQWAQMGMSLAEEYPVFSSVMEEADRVLRDLGAGFSLIEEMRKEPNISDINAPHISQPACTALQIALVALFKSWGIRPSAVVGHSSGEIGAAYAVGAYNLKSAMTLAYHRGQMTLLLKHRYPSLKGAMLAVGTSQDTVRPILKLLRAGYATIACVNSPSSITVSGDCLAIDELESILQEKHLFCRRLKIDVAYHSDHMDKISEDYLSTIKSIHPEPLTNATFYSSVLGRLVESTELGPEYWVKNLTSPVLFPDAIGEMCSSKSPPHLLFEIGPHSALKGPVIDTLKNLGAGTAKILYASAIVRGADAMESILNSAATAYRQGVNLDMNAVNFPRTNARHNSVVGDLPGYPWQHGTRYWHEPRIALKHRTRDGKRNDVLGVLANYSNDMEPTWRNIVRLDEVPWLRDHKMQGLPVFPLAGYLSMAIEAIQRRAETRGISFSGFELREVVVRSALVLGDDSDVETTISVRPYSDSSRAYSASWDEFKISSWAAEHGWTEHCRGLIRVQNTKASNISSLSEMETLHRQARMVNIKTASTQSINSDKLYQALKNLGADYGPTFQGAESCFADCQHSHAEIHVRNTKSVMPKGFEPDLIVHPAFLDGFLHLVWPILGPGRVETTTLYMPTSIQRVYIDLKTPRLPGEHVKAFCKGGTRQAMPEPTRFDILMTAHDSNEIVASLEGLIMTPIRDAKIGSDDRLRKLCYRFEWQPLVTSKASTNGLLTAENGTGMNGLGVGREECASSTDENTILNGQIPQRDARLIETPAINGNGVHSHPVTNGHTIPLSKHPLLSEPNSVNGFHINGHAESEAAAFHVAVFGAPNDVATQLCEAITTLAPQSSIHGLEDIECSGKDVIILETGTSSLRNLIPSLFNSLKRTLLTANSVLWVYREDMPDSQMTVGLARSVRSETMGKILTLGIDAENLSVAAISVIDTINALWPSEGIPCEEREFKSNGSGILVPRVIEDDTANSFIRNETENMATFTQPYAQASRRFKLQIENPGSLDSLFFADDIPSPLAENEVEIEVKATGVNFKDVVVCMGQLSQPYIGIECSGIVSSVGSNVKTVKVGQRVMAMPEGGYSTYARCLETSLYPIPADLSFEEAATMPVVFCTAYYGLFDLARLQRGERVLIHAGAGGVGQAAIMISQMVGAEVYVTVGSDEKRDFLMQRYSIPSDRILCSRDASFASGIRLLTNNEGVDVVLNSLAGELLRETWNCLAPFGRFIEIGKADITRNTGLEMSPFEHNVMFASVDLTKVAKQRPQLMRRILSDISRLTSDGSIRPISPIAIHPISEIEVALRTLQAGKNIGKLVVVPQTNDQVKAVAPKTGTGLLQSDGSYILIGGTGGLGRSMARWMSSRGARNIVLVSRSGALNEKTTELMQELAADGTRVVIQACDVSDQDSVEALVTTKMKDLPPVRGVVHGAMVLRDTLFENMSFDDFEAVTKCKVEGAWNLHHALANSPLDFFISLSSIAGIVGNRGQAAYSAANTFLDGFMAYRRSLNLPGVSIDLAAVSDAGYLADGGKERQQEVLKNIGSQTISEADVLALLAAAITGTLSSSCAGHCLTGLALDDLNSTDTFWLHEPKFSALRSTAALNATLGTSQKANTETIPLRDAIAASPSRDLAIKTLSDALLAKLAKVLTVSVDEIDATMSVSALGLDSLVAIEIRNWIARETGANVQVLELLASKSLVGLAEMVLGKARGLGGFGSVE
ncbi:Type I Iterative PKS [Onygenales sp. PD_10]|nr:Type I Iterative PKS [Onygenales sp. PD_10]